jgi:hypothetical protein
VNEYASRPPTFSNTSSVKGVAKWSCRKASFNFMGSTQILIPPYLFSCTTIGLILSNSFTGSMIPYSNILSISSFTLFLYIGFSLYGHCLTYLASSLRGIFISPRSLVMPFISVNVVGNRSLYSHNNYVILSIVCSSQ